MREKVTVRYLGHRGLSDGGRGFDFSCAQVGVETLLITIEAPIDLFMGPDRIALQEGAGICYETLKSRVETDEERPPSRFRLLSADVAQHRKSRNQAPPGRAQAGRAQAGRAQAGRR